jgi:transposase
MGKKYQQHSEEFKREAIYLVETSGKRVATIADELGISERTLYHWLAGTPRVSITGETEPDLSEEVKRLRRELEVVKQERDILKKAINVFSRESR